MSLQLDEAALLYRLARRVAGGRRRRRDRPLQGREHAPARERAARGRRALVVRPARRAPAGPDRAAARLGAARRRSIATASRTASTSSSATRARSSRRRARARSSSSTAITPTRARAPTTSAGASSSRPAGTCSSTTPSTWAGTGTTTPGSRGSSARSSATTRASSGSPTRARSRTSRAWADAPRRRRRLLERPRGHARRARVAARDRRPSSSTTARWTAPPTRSPSAFPDVELIRAGVNLGFAGGNNAGIRRALDRGADWVLLVNNDATVEPGIVEALAAAAAARPDAGVLACKVLFADSDRLWYAGAGFNPYLGRSRHERFGKPDEPGSAARHRARHGSGMAVSRAAIEAAGLLDEEFFLYAEDLEWCLRIQAAGFAVVYVPEARVRHRVTASSGGAGSPTAELLRGPQRARGRRAPPAAAARADRRATRLVVAPARRAGGAPPALRLRRPARLARLPERANGPSLLALCEWRTSAGASTAACSRSCSRTGTFCRDMCRPRRRWRPGRPRRVPLARLRAGRRSPTSTSRWRPSSSPRRVELPGRGEPRLRRTRASTSPSFRLACTTAVRRTGRCSSSTGSRASPRSRSRAATAR